MLWGMCERRDRKVSSFFFKRKKERVLLLLCWDGGGTSSFFPIERGKELVLFVFLFRNAPYTGANQYVVADPKYQKIIFFLFRRKLIRDAFIKLIIIRVASRILLSIRFDYVQDDWIIICSECIIYNRTWDASRTGLTEKKNT